MEEETPFNVKKFIEALQDIYDKTHDDETERSSDQYASTYLLIGDATC